MKVTIFNFFHTSHSALCGVGNAKYNEIQEWNVMWERAFPSTKCVVIDLLTPVWEPSLYMLENRTAIYGTCEAEKRHISSYEISFLRTTKQRLESAFEPRFRSACARARFRQYFYFICSTQHSLKAFDHIRIICSGIAHQLCVRKTPKDSTRIIGACINSWASDLDD